LFSNDNELKIGVCFKSSSVQSAIKYSVVFVDFNHLKSECFKQLFVIDLPKERRDKIPRKKMKREREKVKER